MMTAMAQDQAPEENDSPDDSPIDFHEMLISLTNEAYHHKKPEPLPSATPTDNDLPPSSND
jgi:hypothetical protein